MNFYGVNMCASKLVHETRKMFREISPRGFQKVANEIRKVAV